MFFFSPPGHGGGNRTEGTTSSNTGICGRRQNYLPIPSFSFPHCIRGVWCPRESALSGPARGRQALGCSGAGLPPQSSAFKGLRSNHAALRFGWRKRGRFATRYSCFWQEPPLCLGLSLVNGVELTSVGLGPGFKRRGRWDTTHTPRSGRKVESAPLNPR